MGIIRKRKYLQTGIDSGNETAELMAATLYLFIKQCKHFVHHLVELL